MTTPLQLAAPLLAALLLLAFPASLHAETPAKELSYNTDVRPILSDKCFLCHGPDSASREAGLRLDSFEEATRDLDGYAAIVPGKPSESELVARITSTDPDEIMPPPKHPFPLSAAERDTLVAWIEQGAEYEPHWAFVPPVPAEVPTNVPEHDGYRNPIDAFVRARLATEKLAPAAEATPATLLRRAALDLTGLPPTPAEIDAINAAAANGPDAANAAYETAVERLLASPRYGERMASWWLDAARYSDTDGYQTDGQRNMWPWRDWVIKAYNENLPFDDFTIQQLAGDMLPDDTGQYQLASAFNRNHRLNNEGGALPEEYIVEYSVDRVETTFAVWQGLTVGCARCHDHKYDPVSQKEFFQLFAYFNAIPERGKAAGKDAPPTKDYTSPLIEADPKAVAAAEAKLATATQSKTDAEAALPKHLATWLAADDTKARFADGASVWVAPPQSAKGLTGVTFAKQDDGSLFAEGKLPANETYIVTLSELSGDIHAIKLEAIPDDRLTEPVRLAKSSNGNFVLTDIAMKKIGGNKPQNIPLEKAEADYAQKGYPVKNAIDGDRRRSGWAIHGGPDGNRTALFTFKKPVRFGPGDTLEVRLAHNSPHSGHNIGRFRLSVTTQPNITLGNDTLDPALLAAFRAEPAKRTPEQKKLLLNTYRDIDPDLKAAIQAEQAADKALFKAKYPVPPVKVMVMSESDKPRPTYLLNRGQYDDPDKSEEIIRDVPAALKADPTDRPGDRLEMARWLVNRDNPLTARVTVNRIWQMHFGVGLVKTAEDFGLQGELPSHPELIDWLAVWFMENGWDKKALHRLIVTSATYRQRSHTHPDLIARDPENRLLARGPRLRLDPYAIRDQALFASGLLNPAIGGPPVKIYQPDGLWNSLASGAGTRYRADKGDKLYRRSLYTYSKRTVGPPLHMLFDASPREVCSIRARVTNTPLQALVLMNDVTFLEAARKLASRVHTDAKTLDERLTLAYRLAAGAIPTDKHLAVFRKNHAWFQKHFAANEDAAKHFLSHGDSKRDDSIPLVDHAALTAVTHLILNLDATITKF